MNPFDFQATPHRPEPHCNGRLVLSVYSTQLMDPIPITITCGMLVHRASTRHHYAGTLPNGATVDVYWRDEATHNTR